jgi:glycosyltransferase involved in cell wall biosynthesis
MNSRIAFFLTSPNGGGAERAMIAVANNFAAAGMPVDLVFGRADGPYRGDVDRRVRIVDLNVKRLRKMLRPMHRYMRREKPDTVVSALTPCDLVMLFGRRFLGWKSKLVISVQNHPVEMSRHSDSWLDRLWPFLIRRSYGAADCVLGISTGVAETVASLLGRSREAVPVIPNPVITPGFTDKLNEEPDHPWFNDGGPPVLLAAGRLTLQKDYPTLFRAFASLLRSRPVRLIVLGEGEGRAELEKLADELGISAQLAMPGFVRNPYCWMKRARLFVLSSRWEGFANVVAEALACGIPVVSTDCPSGPGEILSGGAFGHLVPVGDADALAQALDDALKQPVERDRLVARGMSYGIEDIAPRYLALIQKAIAE